MPKKSKKTTLTFYVVPEHSRDIFKSRSTLAREKLHCMYTKMMMDTSSNKTSFNYEPVATFRDADIIVFTGGGDVEPSLYGQQRLSRTRVAHHSRSEVEAFVYNMTQDQYKLGICRGAQFLNIMCGGSMYQHVDNHTSTTHYVVRYCFDMDNIDWNAKGIIEGKPTRMKYYTVNSRHHQQMIPGDGALIMAQACEFDHKTGEPKWHYPMTVCNKKVKAPEYGSSVRVAKAIHRSELMSTWDDEQADNEAIWYELESCLCIQWHPENPLYNHSDTTPHRRDMFQMIFETLKLEEEEERQVH